MDGGKKKNSTKQLPISPPRQDAAATPTAWSAAPRHFCIGRRNPKCVAQAPSFSAPSLGKYIADLNVHSSAVTIAARAEKEAVRRGDLAGLSGRGKPLPEDALSQARFSLPQNMEARAEAEMRRAERSGLLSKLGGEGDPLPDRHVVSSGSSQAAVQKHVQQETLRK
jgi:hypothetical protein